LEYYLSSLGYAFTGDSQREQIFNYFVGQTASNGKSMPFETLEFLMPNYVKKGTPDILDKGADVRKEIATWRGILLLWINELSTKKKDEDFIKALADGTNHKYNRLYSTESIMMKIGFKIFCVSNNSLNIKVDPGVTRRFKLAEFVSQFKDEYKQDDFEKLEFKLDKDLSEKLKTTYKHAFLYLIFSYSNQYYIDKCLKPYPIEWDNEAKQTLADNDKFKEWFDDNFTMDETYCISKRELENIINQSKFKGIHYKDELKRMKIKFTYKSQERVTGETSKGVFWGLKVKPPPPLQVECMVLSDAESDTGMIEEIKEKEVPKPMKKMIKKKVSNYPSEARDGVEEEKR